MEKGLTQDAVHKQALEYYGVSAHSVYHPNVIAENSGWFGTDDRNFWGIKK